MIGGAPDRRQAMDMKVIHPDAEPAAARFTAMTRCDGWTLGPAECHGRIAVGRRPAPHRQCGGRGCGVPRREARVDLLREGDVGARLEEHAEEACEIAPPVQSGGPAALSATRRIRSVASSGAVDDPEPFLGRALARPHVMARGEGRDRAGRLHMAKIVVRHAFAGRPAPRTGLVAPRAVAERRSVARFRGPFVHRHSRDIRVGHGHVRVRVGKDGRPGQPMRRQRQLRPGARSRDPRIGGKSFVHIRSILGLRISPVRATLRR